MLTFSNAYATFLDHDTQEALNRTKPGWVGHNRAQWEARVAKADKMAEAARKTARTGADDSMEVDQIYTAEEVERAEVLSQLTESTVSIAPETPASELHPDCVQEVRELMDKGYKYIKRDPQ